MRSLLQDALFALRQLLRHRVYAATAALSMALGIGATVAVYSVLHGVLIDPFPYRNSERIAAISLTDKQDNTFNIEFTAAERQSLRAVPVVESVAAYRQVPMLATNGDLPESVPVAQMTGNALQFLDAPPILGRIFTAADAPEGVAPPNLAVVSYLFWKTHLAGSPGALGHTLQLNHHPYTVIGVMGPRFTWLDADVYVPWPAGVAPTETDPGVVRLRPGVSYAVATAQLDSFVQQVLRVHPESNPKGGFRIKVQSLTDSLLQDFKGTLFVLFVAVALLLLIGCGNLSILMLARGSARQQEMAMRSALGASRQRIVRQVLTEAVLLSAVGGAAGIALAYAAIHLIVQLIPQYAIPHEVVITLNVPVLLFSIAVSVLTGILSGLSPALAISRPEIAQMVQAGSSRTVTARSSRTQTLLLGGQIALTVLMLAGAGAAMRSFLEAFRAHLGFDPHNVLMTFIQTPEHSYPTWQTRMNYYDALLDKLESTPGITAATFSMGGAPPRGNWIQEVQLAGTASDEGRKAGVHLVSANYFSVLRIPLLTGRTLTRPEILRGAHLAIVSRKFVQSFLNGRDPIGRQITLPALKHAGSQDAPDPAVDQPFQIVGVVEDVRNDGLHRPILPQVYLGIGPTLFGGSELMVRTDRDPRQLERVIAGSVRAVDANQALTEVYTYDQFLSMFVWSHERFISVLFALFSVVALTLAAVGLISVVAYTVEQRTREIGLRIALGASRRAVLTGTLRPTVRTTAIGLVLGVAFSVGLSNFAYRWTASSMRDASVLALTCAVLLLASAVACILPARRVLRIDPIEALRAN